jgi:acetyl esterase/acyl-CoA thioesterase-1
MPTLTTAEERERFIRYTRIDRWPLLERFPVPKDLRIEMLAHMTASAPEYVRSTLAAMRSAVQADAAQLMADSAFRAAIDAIPRVVGDRLVAIGDSVTADRRGWFELLKEAVALAAPSGVDLVNLGLSGDTTADVLERLDVLAGARPTWVLVMLGTNDTRFHGPKHAYRMVSLAETERNISALMEFVTGDLAADLTLLTPPPGDQARIASFYRDVPVGWVAAELDAVAALIRALDPNCVDVNQSMRGAAFAGLLDVDGVHPTVEGQRHIARVVVERLSVSRRLSLVGQGGESAERRRVRTETGK